MLICLDPIDCLGSSYSALAIAAERYFGICHPNTDSCYRKLRFYVVAILSACLVIDLPRFFEMRPAWSDKTGEAVGIKYTPLRSNPNYIIGYVMWYRLITTIAFPFVLMLFFNFKVFHYYKRTRWARKKI